MILSKNRSLLLCPGFRDPTLSAPFFFHLTFLKREETKNPFLLPRSPRQRNFLKRFSPRSPIRPRSLCGQLPGLPSSVTNAALAKATGGLLTAKCSGRASGPAPPGFSSPGDRLHCLRLDAVSLPGRQDLPLAWFSDAAHAPLSGPVPSFLPDHSVSRCPGLCL